MVTVAPRTANVRLRAYRVGFGDCLLLTVGYAADESHDNERHMLIDLGTKEADDNGPSLTDVAHLLHEHTGGRLDVLVASHRHQDHIGGFGTKPIQELISTLHPRLVIRPWTDVPDNQPDKRARLDPRSRAFIDTLAAVQDTADHVGTFGFDSKTAARRAAALAALGFKNTDALAALEGWAGDERAEYVRAGDEIALKRLLPGVTIQVLGPPTLEQVARLTSYAKTSEEYWLAIADAGQWPTLQIQQNGAETRARNKVAPPFGVGAAEWLLRELGNEGLGQGLELFEAFDDVLNNTSVILLVTVDDRTLLLPGDAQVENWSFALDSAWGRNSRPLDQALRDQLRNVDVYKVGHHGSRNATPTSLYELWKGRSPERRPLTSVLTTKRDVFNKSKEGEVPKPRLVDALRRRGPVYSTDSLDPDVWWFDLTAPTHGAATFVFTAGPTQGRRPAHRQPRQAHRFPPPDGHGEGAGNARPN